MGKIYDEMINKKKFVDDKIISFQVWEEDDDFYRSLYAVDGGLEMFLCDCVYRNLKIKKICINYKYKKSFVLEMKNGNWIN